MIQVSYIFSLLLLYKSFENLLDRPVKKIKLRYQNSPVEAPIQPITHNLKKGKKLLFHEDIREQPSGEVSQKKMIASVGGEDLPDRDLIDNEWAMQYVDLKKKVLLLTVKKKGEGQLNKERPFSYGRMLCFDYKDLDSLNLIILVDCSKGVQKMFLFEDQLVKDSSDPESFKVAIKTSKNLITTLGPYIQGHITLRDVSPSPMKAPQKVSKMWSRPAKKKVSKMSESESSSSTDDEETRATPGAELASGVLSSKQNKIQREIMQKKLVRKGQVFNLPITHIHRPLVDVNT